MTKKILFLIMIVISLTAISVNAQGISIKSKQINIAKIENKSYKGKKIKTRVKITYNGTTLVEKKDYSLSYKNNKNIGKAIVIIKGEGNYYGKVKKTFKIVPKSTTIKSAKIKNQKITLKWKKVKSAQGYKIYTGNGKVYKTIKNNKTTSYTTKKLSTGKTYTFYIKAYAKVKNKKYYSSASNLRTLRISTIGESNALKSAKSYLSFMAFSRQGLIDQLEYEKFTHSQAVYAVNNCGANWNKQALKSAKSYLSHSSFSKEGLIDQLEYEKFTHSQAVYAVNNCGANWNKQAIKTAQSYLSWSSFSRQELIEQLEYEKFTHDQAVYAVNYLNYY